MPETLVNKLFTFTFTSIAIKAFDSEGGIDEFNFIR